MNLKLLLSFLCIGLLTLGGVSNVSAAAQNADSTSSVCATEARITKVSDLAGKRAGYLTGSLFQEELEKIQDEVTYLQYNDNTTAVQALRSGKVDVVLLDEPMTHLWTAYYPEELYFALIYADDRYSYAIQKGNPLKPKIDAVIQQLEQNGELEKFKEKWCRSIDPSRRITKWTHKPDYDGSAGTIRYATDPTQIPMVYLAHNELMGLDIEVLNRVAYELNMKVEYQLTNFAGLIDALLSNKADLVGGCLSITPARLEKVDFVSPYYKGGLAVLARRPKANNTADTPQLPEITSIEATAGKKAGVWTGTAFDNITRKYFPNSEHVQYSKMSDIVLGLKSGKVDFFVVEEPQSRILLNQHPELCRMNDEMLEGWDYGFAFSFQNREICDAFSAEIKKLRADGTIERLKDKWFAKNSNKEMPELPKGSKGTLCIGTIPEVEPFTYVKDGEFVGLDLELAIIIAGRLGYSVEFKLMDFASLAETLQSGKVDMVAACVVITEERKEQMLFTDSHYQGGCVTLVRNMATSQGAGAAATSRLNQAWNTLCASFDRTFVREHRWKLVLEGLGVTILITLAATALGTLLAFPVWLIRTAKSRVLRNIGSAYVAIMQGTPILVILMILYYVIFAKVDINGILVAILGFGLNLAAYAGEMLRSGIDGVPKGQREAALALGFTRFQTFRKVVLPQALRQILPVYRGECIGLLKSTSIVGYIAIQDLTKMSDIIRSRTYEAFFPLIATAVIYFLTAMALAAVLNYAERRLNPNNRRKQA